MTKEKTVFTTGQGLWQFKVMPIGLCNAPATFERLMETVLKVLMFEACLIYVDDVIIGGHTFEEHLENIFGTSCDVCAARKGPKKRNRGKLHRYNVGAPFKLIALDILEPFPRTADNNNYLLVVMGYFTKWPEVHPIPDQEAFIVADPLVHHCIS